MVIAAIFAIPATAAIAQSGDEPLLEDARQRVAEVAERLEGAREEAATAQAELEAADARLRELEAIVNDVAMRLEEQQRQVAQAEAELERLEREAAGIRDAFEERAVSLFKQGGATPIELMLAAGDIDEAIDRSAFIRVLTGGDVATLEGVEATQISIEQQRVLLASERDRLARMKDEQEALLAEVEELRRDRALAAADARAQVAELAERKEDLEADQERIAELIRRRQATPASAALPSTAGYVWPTCGRVTSEFGRRWGRLHAGIDVDDNRTSAIGAAKEGTVIFVGWQGGYGRLTLIDHRDGVVTAYAHQREQVVSEGQAVERGQRIGTIGTTGSSTGTHLHFETRVNGSAVNPRRFLPGGC